MKNILKTTMLLFLLIGFCGCEEEEPILVKRKYINTEATVDGEKDPIHNIAWLNSIYKSEANNKSNHYWALVKFTVNDDGKDYIYQYGSQQKGHVNEVIDYGWAWLYESDGGIFNDFLFSQCIYNIDEIDRNDFGFTLSNKTSTLIKSYIDSVFDCSDQSLEIYIPTETRRARSPVLGYYYCEEGNSVINSATNIEVLACHKIITIENEK